MKKKLQLHAVSTDKKDGALVRWHDRWYPSGKQDSRILTHHLYLTSNDSIEDGDGVYSELSKRVFQIDLSRGIREIRDYRKIVATTNTDLWVGSLDKNSYSSRSGIGLPKIPESLIEYFVENQGNLKEVNVEYYTEQVSRSIIGYTPAKEATSIGNYKINLKLNQSGEIIWSPVDTKTSFTLDDLRDAFKAGGEHEDVYGFAEDEVRFINPSFEDWFNNKFNNKLNSKQDGK